MRSLFGGYYRPTDEEFTYLWQHATIVVDASVLLNFYQYPTKTQSELLDVFGQFANRLWIPYQVAGEYQRNRLRVIQDRHKKLNETKEALGIANARIAAELVNFEGSEVAEAGEVQSKITALHKGIEEVIDKALKQIPAVSLDDPVRDKLDALFAGKVGSAPPSQNKLNEIFAEGRVRYQFKQPPGFKDEKEKKDIRYVQGGLQYEAQYGDLVLWNQLIAHCANAGGPKAIILVNAERKEDWWRVVGGTIGPHPELVTEIKVRAGVTHFWMYDVSSFLAHAKELVGADVSEESIQEVREVEEEIIHEDELPEDQFSEYVKSGEPREALKATHLRTLVSRLRIVRKAVLDWITTTLSPGNLVTNADSFPEMVLHAGSGPHGLEIKQYKNRINFLAVDHVLSRADRLIRVGEIDRFTLILVLDRTLLSASLGDHDEGFRELSSLTQSRPRVSVLCGRVASGQFLPIWEFGVEGLYFDSSIP